MAEVALVKSYLLYVHLTKLLPGPAKGPLSREGLVIHVAFGGIPVIKCSTSFPKFEALYVEFPTFEQCNAIRVGTSQV